MARDGTSKIYRLPTGEEVNDKQVDLSRFASPVREGRHLRNRRDW